MMDSYGNNQRLGDMVHICGQIVKLNTGCPKPNRWLSGKIKTVDGDIYPVAGTGSVMFSVGDIVECDAIEEFNDYGLQYRVRKQSLIMPVASTKSEVISYLSGPAFKGIGFVTAEKLYNIYKVWTIPTIMSDRFAWSAKLHGFSDDFIQSVQNGLKESAVCRRLSAVFPHLPVQSINRILDQNKSGFVFDTFVDLVRGEPYTILHDLYGVRVKDADSVALYDCQFAFNSDKRLAFFMKIAIHQFCSARHATYVKINDEYEWNEFFLYSFIRHVSPKMAEPLPDTFSKTDLRIWLNQYIKTNKRSGLVVVDGGALNSVYPYGMEPRIDVNGKAEYALYSHDLYEAERFLCETVKYMSSLHQPDKLVKRFSQCHRDSVMLMPDDMRQAYLSHPLDQIQISAVKMPWKYQLSFVTGGPGRGKTSCLSAMIYSWLRMKDRHVILLAPTGKAIKRMQQQTGYHCGSTIARFLMLNKNTTGKIADDCMLDPLKNPVRKCSNVLVVVDEASMLCFTEASELLHLIRDCTVVFVGDKNQLPPIEAGPFLQQCLASSVAHVTELTENYRSGSCDWVDNPEQILRGGTMKDLKRTVNFMVIPASEEVPEEPASSGKVAMSPAEQYIVNEYSSCIQQDEYSGVMLLTPFTSSKYALSTARLNALLQDKLNPKAKLPNPQKVQGVDPYCGRTYCEGRGKLSILRDSTGVVIRTNDRIMNTKNFPDQQILLFKNNSMEMRDLLDDDQVKSMFGSVPSGIYNGDIGIVRRVYDPFGRDSYQMLVELEGEQLQFTQGVQGKTTSFSRFVLIDIGDDGKTFDNWILAYALSIHKSQGCEANHVIITIPSMSVGMDSRSVGTGTEPFITRNMFYTAVTRSSQTVTIVGEMDALNEFMKYPYRYYNVRLADLLDDKVK